MKYLKRFEGRASEYANIVKVGDILICIDSYKPLLKNGNKYKVIRIKKPRKKDVDQFYYFDVEDIDNGEIARVFEDVSTPYKVGDYALIKVQRNGVIFDNVLVKIKFIKDKDIHIDFIDNNIFPKATLIIAPYFIQCWSDNKDELIVMMNQNKYYL